MKKKIVRWSGSGHLELRSDPLRVAHRNAAIRRRERAGAIQEDPLGRVHNSGLPEPTGGTAHREDAHGRPDEARHHQGHPRSRVVQGQPVRLPLPEAHPGELEHHRRRRCSRDLREVRR